MSVAETSHFRNKLLDGQKKTIVLLFIYAITIVIILPLFFKWQVPVVSPFTRHTVRAFTTLLIFGILAGIYVRERHYLDRNRCFSLVYFILILTLIVNKIHNVNVDHVRDLFPSMSNLSWQELMQSSIMNGDPAALPHSYRFFPNCVVRWMELGGLSYPSGRDIYRQIFGMLLFYAIYRYARLYTTYLGAIVSMLLVAAISPISFMRYAGQLTDPASHLSFVLALIFLETADFASLIAALAIGSLAKETVLAMAGYYVLFSREDPLYKRRVLTLVAVVLAAYFGVRLLILRGALHYQQVSGTSYDHVWGNVRGSGWVALFLLTACSLLPFLLISWRSTPLSLKRQYCFLLPVLFVSSALFSWLHEARNYMPLAFILAVVTSRYLISEHSQLVTDPLRNARS